MTYYDPIDGSKIRSLEYEKELDRGMAFEFVAFRESNHGVFS